MICSTQEQFILFSIIQREYVTHTNSVKKVMYSTHPCVLVIKVSDNTQNLVLVIKTVFCKIARQFKVN